MKAGIIGLPSSGKTTLWCLLTEAHDGPDPAQAGKLQLRTVKVDDERLERLRDDYKPKKYTPASIELGDFPAVVRNEQDRGGVAELLAPARTMDTLIVVLRGFESDLVPPPGGKVDPLSDWEEVRGELLLSDLVIVEKRVEKLRVQVKKPTPTQAQDRKELALLERVKEHLEADRQLTDFHFVDDERRMVQGFQFLSAKPKIPVINRGESRPAPEVIKALEEASGSTVYDLPVLNELEVLQLSPEDQELFREELGVEPGTRERILASCYSAASLISFFTAGEKEVRAWTIRSGDPAVIAAGAIHSDIARGFIRAETVAFEDYARFGSIKGARENGQLRLEGKEYAVQDGDIIEFRHNV